MKISLKLLMRCSASAVMIVGLSACANTKPCANVEFSNDRTGQHRNLSAFYA